MDRHDRAPMLLFERAIMYQAKVVPAEAAFMTRFSAILRATSITQRSLLVSVLTVCSLVVSDAAIAPGRILVKDAASVERSESGMSGSALDKVLAGGSADTSVRMPAALLRRQTGLVPAKMTFVGETGSEIHFDDDALSPDPNSAAGNDEAEPLLPGAGRYAALSSHGSFGSPASDSNLAGAVAATRISATRAGATGTTGVTSIGAGPAKAGTAGIIQISNCSLTGSCAAPEIILTTTRLTMVAGETGLTEIPRTPSRRQPATSQPPTTQSDSIPGIQTTPVGITPIINNALPRIASQENLLVAAPELPAVNVPEPGSLALFGVGVLVFFARHRLRQSTRRTEPIQTGVQ